MRDGVRRITDVVEVVGMEGETITTQSLFAYKYQTENPDGTLRGTFEATGLRPRFMSRIAYYGLAQAFLDATTPGAAD